MERTAKANGINYIIDEDNPELITLVYGYIRQFCIYKNYHALVVDDSHIDSCINANLLTSEFIKSTIETNPNNVIERLKNDSSFNMLLLDYQMPDINGCQLMNMIRQEFPDRAFIFIGLTGCRDGVLKFTQLGADDVIRKPLDTEIVALNLRKAIFNFHRHFQVEERLHSYKRLLVRLADKFRNPITSLMTVNELMSDTNYLIKNSTQLETLSTKVKKSINNIFDELLGYIEVDSYQHALKFKTCSLNSLIATQLFLESQQAKHKNIIIDKYCDEKISALCIPSQIESVITNLTNNAVKYSSIGSKVDIRLYSSNCNIIFEVEDSSPRIPEDEFETIFEPYSHASTIDSKGKEKSLGLGLVLCKEIINAHGGDIGVRNGDRGNIFYFNLPLAKVSGIY